MLDVEGSSLAQGEYVWDDGKVSTTSGFDGLVEAPEEVEENRGELERWFKSGWMVIALLMLPPVGVRRSHGAGGLSAYDEWSWR